MGQNTKEDETVNALTCQGAKKIVIFFMRNLKDRSFNKKAKMPYDAIGKQIRMGSLWQIKGIQFVINNYMRTK